MSKKVSEDVLNNLQELMRLKFGFELDLANYELAGMSPEQAEQRLKLLSRLDGDLEHYIEVYMLFDFLTYKGVFRSLQEAEEFLIRLSFEERVLLLYMFREFNMLPQVTFAEFRRLSGK